MGKQLEKAERRLLRIEEVRTRLDQEHIRLDQEHAKTATAVAYLREHEDEDEDDEVTQVEVAPKREVRTVAEAVRMVMKASNGRSMTVEEIWREAQALGASSEARRPLHTVEVTLRNLDGATLVGRRLWQMPVFAEMKVSP